MTGVNHVTREISDLALLHPAPLVSVYMLTYMHRPYIEQAVAGVVAQKCDFGIELIIGEDHSPDGTLELLERLQMQYPSLIRILTSGSNVGGKANSARCLAAARGQYIAICEGDDYWTDPRKLALQIEVFLREPTCSLVFHSARVVDAMTGHDVAISRWSRHSRRFTRNELVLGDGGLIQTASMLVRRDVFETRKPWALQAPIGDYPLVLAASLAGTVEYIDRCMSVYRANVPHSWTSRHQPTIAHKLQYASGIETMLSGFAANAPDATRAARKMISKYYSDAIVLSQGTQRERREAWVAHAGKIQGLDRLFAWLAARTPLRLPRMKVAFRKANTALRLMAARLTP
jgi:glycosyltransferase involved in cell wall biosynthesis